jgi:hypothetical protein
MKFLPALLGVGLIILVIRDIFHTLLHPSGRGSLSEMLPWVTWRMFRRLAKHCPSVLPFAGPGAFLAVIASWIIMPAVGWALIYWPYMPAEFIYASGLDPSVQGGFIDALYLSFATLTTIGYGDIVPTSGWLRMLAPLEGLLGFGVFTAAVSWILSIYPVLSRRWSPHEITLMQDAEEKTGIGAMELNPDAAEQVPMSLTAQLVSVGSDLRQFPITYYFRSSDEGIALSNVMPYLARLVERGGSADGPPATQLRATMLRGAIDDFSSQVASRFLGLQSTSTAEVLTAYARDHLRMPH